MFIIIPEKYILNLVKISDKQMSLSNADSFLCIYANQSKTIKCHNVFNEKNNIKYSPNVVSIICINVHCRSKSFFKLYEDSNIYMFREHVLLIKTVKNMN